MAVKTPLVFKIEPAQCIEIQKRLSDLNMELSEPQYVAVRGKNADGIVTLYTSGKLVIQGQKTDSLIAALSDLLPTQAEESSNKVPLENGNPHIGTDESGKGDYFGPLVIAAVYADSDLSAKLIEIGAKDSKKLADSQILQLDEKIRRLCPYSVVAIGPGKYNELYDKIRNLNKLLAWGHARALENLLNQVKCSEAITDQFGDERFVRNALMKRGREITLEQHPRAEADPAVAAASILARAEFVKRLKALSGEIQFELPKGADRNVDSVGREIYRKLGLDGLKKVAKTHFATTAKVVHGS